MSADRWPIATEQLQRGVPGLRYRRSLYGADGAFPDSAEYAASVERPAVGPGGEWWLYAALVVAGLACGALGLGRWAWLAVLTGGGVAAWRLARGDA